MKSRNEKMKSCIMFPAVCKEITFYSRYDVFMPYLRGTHWYSCTERRPRGHTVQISVRNNLECHNYVPGMYKYQFSKGKHLFLCERKRRE